MVGLLVAGTLAELALRSAGFEYRHYPTQIQFGWPDPETLETKFEPDPDLFWVLSDYDEILDAAQKPDLVFMGDSCTHLGHYPEYLRALYEQRHPQQHLRTLRAAVTGWSTHQGRVQLERDLLPLSPRVITVYFGWNDHWLSMGLTDREMASQRLDYRYFPALYRSRVAQLLFRFYTERFVLAGIDERPVRVPPADFRANLVQLVGMARAHDIAPVLITAPSAHREGREPELLLGRWVVELDELIPMHQQYVGIVRQVAGEHRVPLLDLARRFEAQPEDDWRKRYFMHDGIHLQPEGDQLIARWLLQLLTRERLLPSSGPPAAPR